MKHADKSPAAGKKRTDSRVGLGGAMSLSLASCQLMRDGSHCQGNTEKYYDVLIGEMVGEECMGMLR